MKREYVVTYFDGYQRILLVGDANEAWATKQQYDVRNGGGLFVSEYSPVDVVVRRTGEKVPRPDLAAKGELNDSRHHPRASL